MLSAFGKFVYCFLLRQKRRKSPSWLDLPSWKIRAFLGSHQRYVVIPYRRLGTACQSHLQWSRNSRIPDPLKLGPETWVRNCQFTLRNIPKERWSHQRYVVIPYRRLGTACRSHLQWSRNSRIPDPLKMGPETWVRNCHFTLRYIPKERGSHLLRGASLKSRTFVTG